MDFLNLFFQLTNFGLWVSNSALHILNQPEFVQNAVGPAGATAYRFQLPE